MRSSGSSSRPNERPKVGFVKYWLTQPPHLKTVVIDLRTLSGALLSFRAVRTWWAAAPDGESRGEKCTVVPWEGEIPGKKRFVSTFDGAAFCDRQTGLVLEKSPENATMALGDALVHCINRTVGGSGQKG